MSWGKGMPRRQSGESENAFDIRYEKWRKRSNTWQDTPARRQAREMGSKIRTITCIDAMARLVDPWLRSVIRPYLDQSMNDLGYEGLTEHQNRTHKLLEKGHYEDKDFKYQRLPDAQQTRSK